MTDIVICAFEDSGDLHGANLIKELLQINPDLSILGVAGPRMRQHNIQCIMKMEDFKVMGFTDVLFSLPKLIKNFFHLRKTILQINPKTCIFIDYPDFTLRLENSLRRKKYRNKIVHFICPTIWAWRKNRIKLMSKNQDLLLSIFPFEKKHFSNSKLNIQYIGHPLAYILKDAKKEIIETPLIGIFSGSRKQEIMRNLPIQLSAAKRLLKENENLKFAISTNQNDLVLSILKKNNIDRSKIQLFNPCDNYKIMPKLTLAMATSGTVNLELALHQIPSVINFAIKPIDLFIATKILKINLPYYCIVNIILEKEVFKELYGPNLSVNSLYKSVSNLLKKETMRKQAIENCLELKNNLKCYDANKKAATKILDLI